ncbi:MAG: acyl-CoA thioesterase, partial [Waterburya sp.]
QAGVSLQQILQAGKIILPITHAEIDFVRPLFCGDRLQVNLVADLINQSEFAIAYQIYNVNNLDQILAQAKTQHVCINPQIKKRVDLPFNILAWLENNQYNDTKDPNV